MMKCPKCGADMHVDEHRRYALNMCYECGYIEGRMNDTKKGETNLEHLKKLNFNEAVAFFSHGMGLDEKAVSRWLDKPFDK